MNGMLIKKLNQILNFKNVRCSKCDRFVNFITHESSDTYGVMNFDFFDCECGLKKHDIDNVAYVTTKIGERIDLLDYLKLSKLMDDKEDSANDLYLKLDMVDSKLQDRNKASQDVQSSLDLNMEDIINNYENILKAKFEKDFSCSMEDVIRRIVSYQEIDGGYEIELKNKSPWFSSQEWEWIETEIDNLNGYSVTIFLNKDENLMAMCVYLGTEPCETAVFDIKKLYRFENKDNSSYMATNSMAIMLLGTNLIRRAVNIEEIVYEVPKFELRKLANNVLKQVRTGEIYIDGQDTKITDWIIDRISDDEFSFVNSRGSKINFEISSSSKEFMYLSTISNTVGKACNGFYSGYIADKIRCNIPKNIETFNVMRKLFAIKHLEEGIDVFKDAPMRYKSIKNSIPELKEWLNKELYELGLILTKEEIDELRSMKMFLYTSDDRIKMKESYLSKEEYNDLRNLVEIIEIEYAIYGVDEFYESEEYFAFSDGLSEEVKMIEEEKVEITEMLIEKHTECGLRDMINNSYSGKNALHILDTIELGEC